MASGPHQPLWWLLSDALAKKGHDFTVCKSETGGEPVSMRYATLYTSFKIGLQQAAGQVDSQLITIFRRIRLLRVSETNG